MNTYEIIGGADGPTSIWVASPWGGFGRMNTFEVIFQVFMVLFAAAFVFILLRGLLSWRRNNQSPRLTVEAMVVAKRDSVRTHHHDSHHHHYMNYYATFQVESDDRMELEIPEQQYGLLAEGDRGRLTFQGTRFIGFERFR